MNCPSNKNRLHFLPIHFKSNQLATTTTTTGATLLCISGRRSSHAKKNSLSITQLTTTQEISRITNSFRLVISKPAIRSNISLEKKRRVRTIVTTQSWFGFILNGLPSVNCDGTGQTNKNVKKLMDSVKWKSVILPDLQFGMQYRTCYISRLHSRTECGGMT